MFSMARRLVALFVVPLPFLLGAAPMHAQTCPADTPPECTVNDQFAAGRVEFSELSGSYTVSGTEAYFEADFEDTFSVSGTLNVELVGGSAENYLDVACDGTVTGQGKDKITGLIDRTFLSHGGFCPGGIMTGSPSIDGTGSASWNVAIERTYSITGSVTDTGELELDLAIDEASFEFLDDSRFSENNDCEWREWLVGLSGIDLSRSTPDVERVRLADTSYDPSSGANWNPDVELLDATLWLERVGKLFQVGASYDYDIDGSGIGGGVFYDPMLLTQAEFDEQYSSGVFEYNSLFFTSGPTVTFDTSFAASAKQPVITDMQLEEPAQFLSGVMVDTTVKVTIDWRDADAPQQVEFTYGSTTETVTSGGEETTWTFDAGESGTTIKAKATSGSGDSQEWEIATPKIMVPGWAGEAGDWSGSSGVRYEAMLDWPVSLETTETIDSLSLVTGLFGVTGSITSEFNAKAQSSGSALEGDLMTHASLQLAGNEYSFDLTGSNSTTLACDALTTEGDATAQFPELTWKKTLNPLTAIPGVESAVCSLGSLMCGLVTGVGLKGEVSAGLSGSGMFTGDGAELEWSDGSLEGSLSASISFQAIPPPLSAVVSLGFEGGGSGCLGFQFSPMFELETLGGEIHVGLNASFLGLKVNPSHDWMFGDTCAGRGQEQLTLQRGGGAGPVSAWVPADGQLAMAVNETAGAAVWADLPASGDRPLGDLRLRRFDMSLESWGSVVSLTSGSADMAPAAEFDAQDNLLVVYQRSTAAAPTHAGELAAFSNALELHYLLIDAADSVIASGQITTNAIGDFGATLRRDAAGELHLFWQRATDAEVGGTVLKPVSVHVASWDTSTASFTGIETAASGLDFTLGWHPAAASSAEMLIALTIDTDDDYTTADDREIFQITKSSGTWLPLAQVSVNGVADDAPIAAYEGVEPILLWRRAGQALELQGDLSAAALVAFDSPSPATDGGLSASFATGRAVAGPDGLAVFWPESLQLALNWNVDGWGPTVDAALAGTAGPISSAETVHAVRAVGREAIVGFATRDFVAGNASLEPMMTPEIGRVSIAPGIFADGFETGDAALWSATTR